MNGLGIVSAISAVVFIGLGVVFAGSLLISIGSEFESPRIWKAIASTFVLFFLSGVFRVVARGMSDRPKDKV
jgi:hypothetical protein